jgi:N-methylhydantoinase A
VCFDAAAGHVPTAIFVRPGLRAGDAVVGPAVIEEYGATVPVHPGYSATVDGLGNLVVARHA